MSIQVGFRTFQNCDELEAFVVHCATDYELYGYVEDEDGIEVTDPEYDELVKALRKQRPDADALKGTSPSKAKPKGAIVKHDPPMTSIDKADGTPEEKRDAYNQWVVNITKLNRARTPEIAQEYKRDGAAVRINYVKGKLVSAGQRPRNGVDGTDVTRHMKFIKGVPLKLPKPLTLSLNGEIECWLDDFEQINQQRIAAGLKPWKNPRNYVAGCLGRDDPKENKDGGLRISFYSITGFAEWKDYYATEIERAKWANSPDGLNLRDENGNGFYVRSIIHRDYSQLEALETKSKELPYYTDGVVLKVNDLELYEDMGHVGDDPTGYPRGALAWKYEEERAEAVVSRIEWNASRTGRVVPTAIFDTPFVLADTENRRATCNNIGWMETNGLGPGAVVLCKKGGKIIPNICGVIKPVKDVGAPQKCPACVAKLVINVSSSGNKDLTCPNPECAAKHVNGWIHYFSKMGSKGLGEAAMQEIVESGKVRQLPDFYRLTKDDLMEIGFSERESLLILAAVWMVNPVDDNEKLEKAIEKKGKVTVQAWVLFQAFGIPGAGETAGKALVKHYGGFEPVRKATEDELTRIAGIGNTTAESIHEWFSKNNPMVDEILEFVDLELPKTGKLTGKNFVLTGEFKLGKKTYKSLIESNGGNCQSSVGKTTDYLLREMGTGGAPSEKEQKAVKLGVPVISPADLDKMI